jgi:dTMP kinase
MTARAGRFIVLEGIDGSGTTTQAKRLCDALEAEGTPVCLTCEPTPGPIGQLIRQALKRGLTLEGSTTPHALPWSAMALLFAADRLDHVETVVLPALALGKTVVSDRYVVSSLAYQSVTSPEGERAIPWIREINSRALRADLTLVLDVDADVAAVRRVQRGGPTEIYEVSELQRRLAEVYAHAEDLVPGDEVVHVADGTPDDVALRVLGAVLGA